MSNIIEVYQWLNESYRHLENSSIENVKDDIQEQFSIEKQIFNILQPLAKFKNYYGNWQGNFKTFCHYNKKLRNNGTIKVNLPFRFTEYMPFTNNCSNLFFYESMIDLDDESVYIQFATENNQSFVSFYASLKDNFIDNRITYSFDNRKTKIPQAVEHFIPLKKLPIDVQIQILEFLQKRFG